MSRFFYTEKQIESKVCSLCEEEKTCHEFSKTSQYKFNTRCKACVKANTKESEYSKVAKYRPDIRFDRSKKTKD